MCRRSYYYELRRFILFIKINSSNFVNFQFLGKWYEVERSFYLPEIASGCTTVAFENTTQRDFDGKMLLEIAVKTINQWWVRIRTRGLICTYTHFICNSSWILNLESDLNSSYTYFNSTHKLNNLRAWYIPSAAKTS